MSAQTRSGGLIGPFWIQDAGGGLRYEYYWNWLELKWVQVWKW
jgi:hypothetical protein